MRIIAGKLKQEYSDVYMHTHLSENQDEVSWVKSLFPTHSHYVDVYHHYGLAKENKRGIVLSCIALSYKFIIIDKLCMLGAE